MSKKATVSIELGDDGADPVRQTVGLADELGFESAWLGDHFMPWTHTGGGAGMVWSLLGVCLERTKRIKMGPLVTTPIGGRYHPALVAQAAAMLDSIYPGRLLLAVGAGEAINEYPFMQQWPPWRERIDRLVEGVELIRKLWESDSYFDFEGKFFGKRNLFLYSKPKTKINIVMSGFGAKSAEIAGRYGDGLMTTTARCPFETCKGELFPSFDKGARAAGKDPDALEKIVLLAYTFEDKESYLKSARERAVGRLAKGALDDADPRSVEDSSGKVSREDALRRMHFITNFSDLVELISSYHRIGATKVILPCGPDTKLLQEYAKQVLPHFKE